MFRFLSWPNTWCVCVCVCVCVLNINTGLGFMFGLYCNNKQSLTWTWGQQVSELLLITGMNKVINTVTQQLQLSETKTNLKSFFRTESFYLYCRAGQWLGVRKSQQDSTFQPAVQHAVIVTMYFSDKLDLKQSSE